MDNNCSQFSLQVGSMDESDNCPHVKACVHVNADKAAEYAEKMKDAKEIDTEYALVIMVPVQEGGEDEVKDCLDTCMTSEDYKGGLCREFRRSVKRGELVYKSECCKEHHMVLMSFAPPEMVVEQAKMQLDQMLPALKSDLAKNQNNFVKVEAVFGNNFSEMEDLMQEKGYTPLMALMQSFRCLANVSLNKNLPDKLGQILGVMFKPMGVPVDMFVNLAKIYGSLDVAVQFNSTDMLPKNVQKRIGSEMNEIKKIKVRKEQDVETMETLCSNLGANVVAHIVVPDLLGVHVSINAPKLGKHVMHQHVER